MPYDLIAGLKPSPQWISSGIERTTSFSIVASPWQATSSWCSPAATWRKASKAGPPSAGRSMSVGPPAGWSRTIFTAPRPRQLADTNTQPASGRENLSAWLPAPMASTSSRVLVRLLSCGAGATVWSAAVAVDTIAASREPSRKHRAEDFVMAPPQASLGEGTCRLSSAAQPASTRGRPEHRHGFVASRRPTAGAALAEGREFSGLNSPAPRQNSVI